MKKSNFLFLFSLFLTFLANAQIKVSGTVTDLQKGEVLIGVNVKVLGENKGVVTDFDGRYELTCEPDANLEFSF